MLSWDFDPKAELLLLRDAKRAYDRFLTEHPDAEKQKLQAAAVDRHLARLEAQALEEAQQEALEVSLG